MDRQTLSDRIGDFFSGRASAQTIANRAANGANSDGAQTPRRIATLALAALLALPLAGCKTDIAPISFTSVHNPIAAAVYRYDDMQTIYPQLDMVCTQKYQSKRHYDLSCEINPTAAAKATGAASHTANASADETQLRLSPGQGAPEQSINQESLVFDYETGQVCHNFHYRFRSGGKPRSRTAEACVSFGDLTAKGQATVRDLQSNLIKPKS